MREHPEWRRELARRMGCKLEYRWLGYDMDCNGTKYLLRVLRRDNSVALTYAAYEEAKRFYPRLLVLDRNYRPLVELSYAKWMGILMSTTSSTIYVNDRPLKIMLLPGKKGKELRLVVDEDIYHRWLEALRANEGDWMTLLGKMLSCLGY